MKISVIIPCYNVEEYIHTCMNSLLNQTIGVENLEIILVDDKSTDNTVACLKEYEEAYPDQVMLILCNKNGRQGTARNIGLSYATGEYVSFVDSDDWVRKDMFEILVDIIEKTESDIVQFDFKGTKVEIDDEPIGELRYDCYDFVKERRKYLLNTNVFSESCCRKIYRRELLLQAGVRYAEGVSYEEPLFTYPLKFYANRVCRLYASLYYYRYNDKGTTVARMQDVETILEHLEVQEMTYYFMKEKTPFYDVYKDEIDLYFIHTFYAEAFYFLRYRGIVIPINIFRYISMELKRLIPNYLKNPYLEDATLAEERYLLLLIEELETKPDEVVRKRLREVVEQLQE